MGTAALIDWGGACASTPMPTQMPAVPFHFWLLAEEVVDSARMFACFKAWHSKSPDHCQLLLLDGIAFGCRVV